MILLMLGLIGLFIFLGQDLLVPLSFAFLLAILLLPAVNWLEKKTGRVIAILLALFLSLIIIVAVFYFLSSQLAGFMEDLPGIKKQLQEHYHTLQTWIGKQFNMSVREQDKMVDEAAVQVKSSGNGFIGQALSGLTNILVIMVLLPVYTFLLLYYRKLLSRFVVDVFDKKHEPKVKEVMTETKTIVNSYMVGLMIEMAIVAAINSAGFLIIGINYAIFLGVFAAILNLVPYIGMLIATLFCMLITLTSSKDMTDIIWVGVILIVVQFIDNNIIMPRVVSSKVKVNALVSIIGVVIGGSLAGVSGMFLSIPAIAFLKTIFERVDETKPWGMLLGDDTAPEKMRIGKKNTAKNKTR
jgi:predicted PurR-regulated permease PerM